MAEGIFRHLLQQQSIQHKWHVDSASLADWQNGYLPDPRTMELLEKHGVEGYTHISRLITEEDFTKFHYIFGMDKENISYLNDIKPKSSTAVIDLLGSHDPQKKLIIVDPFVTHHYNENAFNDYEQCVRCCKAFLDKIEKNV